MANRSRADVMSMESPEDDAFSQPAKPASRPVSSSGRSKQAKLSEFRNYLYKEELPILIENKHGGRIVTWTTNLEQLDFGHYLPVCVSGLQETLEPYPSFAFDAAMALLESGMNDTRVLRALPQVMVQIKAALKTRDKAVVHRVLLVLQQLTVCEGVGEALTEYYRSVLPVCNILQDKHLGTGDETTKEIVAEVLETMEAYGKDDAHVMIQQYVPSFTCCSDR